MIVAIEHCLTSVSTDTSAAEYLGVTLEPQDDGIMLYATDDVTIARAGVSDGWGLSERAIIQH